ncbi:MAG TPA: dTDP-4-dehydrorhamnose reductase [Thermoanaerobaculia bacterium]|jgi:dTDP-4-dehydrorhamnose reductase|nr:dTDP-4-dehydrorhamnose reductase [Thermoanaerobaculia bacterium]
MTRRWLITGAGGMVGTDLRDELLRRGEEVVAASRCELDVTDASAVASLVERVRPTILINCAAYTKVDDAETNEALANAINGSAVEHLAHAADRADALLVHISTDFIFDGAKRTPYEINDVPSPLSAYGRSKLIGEQAAARARRHLIVRTAWLFGVHGPNFVEAMRNQVRKGNTRLRVVNDQRGRPTYTPHLADALIRLSLQDARGIVHYADEGECTWYDFARAIVGDAASVEPVTSAEFPRPARRPAYSVLSTERYERLTGVRPASWEEGLREYLQLRA